MVTPAERSKKGRGGAVSLTPTFKWVWVDGARKKLLQQFVSCFSAEFCQLSLVALHSYSRAWLHVVWATLDRRPFLSKPAAAKLSDWLSRYAEEKGIYMKLNFVNPDHVHALVDLPVQMAIDEMMQLLKGSSSHWINQNNLVPGKFAWGRGYGVFSVSHSGVAEVARYIAGQEEHHRRRSFSEELRLFVERYGLKWRDEKTVETVISGRGIGTPR